MRNHYLITLFLIVLLVTSCGVRKSILERPNTVGYKIDTTKKKTLNDSLFFKGKSSLRKNNYGQWELIAFGENPLDLGNTIGSLTQELANTQETIFFDKINEFVPSKFKQYLLKKFLAIYNRKIQSYIDEEYKIEIYGVSQYASNKYDRIADKYLRSLYLHSAHDIGHALQDLALVGCSSFAVWNNNTVDGKLIIARNFDFYVGNDFAKEKVISFIQPQKGYKYMAVSWAGMIGVMSGMNEKGLTVTINAGKSDIPLLAKTPISLVTREILQYASTIKEAITIAKNKNVFVSESIMVGSAMDNKAILIEISPKNFDVYNLENTSQLISSNHFQSNAYIDDKKNKKHILESHSKYRFDRMQELLAKKKQITPQKAVAILRDKEGLNNKKIGYGNEKALNQLLAHHGIVFKPDEKKVWISANPYQLGEFVAFQLDSVFKNAKSKKTSLSLKSLTIAKDPFVDSSSFRNYEQYRKVKKEIEIILNEEKHLSIEKINKFLTLNPNFWEAYALIGKYYYKKKQYRASLNSFKKALTKEITTIPDKEMIEKYIKKIKRKRI